MAGFFAGQVSHRMGAVVGTPQRQAQYGGPWRQSPPSRPRKARWLKTAAIAAKPPAQRAVAANGGNRRKAAHAKRGGENGGRKAARAERWWRNMAAIAAKPPAQSAGGDMALAAGLAT